jgi:hypothetical protein
MVGNYKMDIYFLSCDAPKQFTEILNSILDYDRWILTNNCFLINQSNGKSFDSEYSNICHHYNINHIKCKNRGCSGGRHTAAEFFKISGSDMMMFLEDDMLFNRDIERRCRFGMSNRFDNLTQTCIDIIKEEDLDFIKLNFHEVFNDHSRTWPDSKNTKFTKLGSKNNIPYLIGDIYFSNWPMIITKLGSNKLFLEEIKEEKYIAKKSLEMFELGTLKAGVVLGYPTIHTRIQIIDNHRR